MRPVSFIALRSRLPRRSAPILLVALLACILGSCASSSPAGEKGPPDILLIMPDQMRGDCLSALGHPVLRTPTLDRLAKEGVLFRRAIATVPSCIPARYALLTGLHPQTSGVVGYQGANGRVLRSPAMPEVLAVAGYETVLVGRNMHQPEASGSCGYRRQILGSTYVHDDDYDRHLKGAAPETGGIKKLIDELGVTTNFWEAEAWPLAAELHPTAWVATRSREVLAETPGDRPLFLTASFYAPHPPLFPPTEDFERYLAADLPPAARGDWVEWEALPANDPARHRVRLEGETLRRAQAGYFGLIEQLDRELAALIDDFKARARAAGRDWVVVFTSDHGEMLGDHGYFRKCEPYEGSANVPLIVAASRDLGFAAGRRVDRPVCLEDIMPTLLSLAGTKSPEPVDGVDLGPALRGEDATIRDWLHFEHAPCYGRAQAFHALSDGRFKYVWRPDDGAEQLFDLAADPREERDLSADAAARPLLEVWRARLVERLRPRPEGFVANGRLVTGRPYPALNDGVPRERR